MRTQRSRAAEHLAGAALPTTEEEVWRYSRIGELDLGRWRPVADAQRLPVRALDDLAAHYRERDALVAHSNGATCGVELADDLVAKGVTVGSATGAGLGEGLVGSVESRRRGDVFCDLNAAFTIDPIVIDVPPGVVLERPIVLVGWLDGSDAAVFPRLVVRVGEGAAATVVDHLGSTADCAAFVAPVVELVVEPSARLGYTCVQDLGPHVWHIGSQISEIEAQATLVSGVAALGGDYARQRFDCHLVGRGATGQLRAVYHGDEDQTLDFRTFQRHIAADTTSDLLFKGAVDDRARSVYTGLIHVHPEARGTNAFQTNRNIMLSRESWAESVPNLEIENNDVRCSHASTVGPIDADQRFYLESRGVPPRAAERLVVGGFFDEVIDTLPAPQAGAWLRARIGEVLDRRGTNDG